MVSPEHSILNYVVGFTATFVVIFRRLHFLKPLLTAAVPAIAGKAAGWLQGEARLKTSGGSKASRGRKKAKRAKARTKAAPVRSASRKPVRSL